MDIIRAIFTSDLWKSWGMSTKKGEGTWQKHTASKCPNRGFNPNLSQSKNCTSSNLASWYPEHAAEISDGEKAILIFVTYSWNRAWQVVFIPSIFIKRIWIRLWKVRSLILMTRSHLQLASTKIHIMEQKSKSAVFQPSMEPSSALYMEQGQVCFNMNTRWSPSHLLDIFAVMTLEYRI